MLNVVEHPNAEEDLVAVALEVLPVALLQVQLAVVLLVGDPAGLRGGLAGRVLGGLLTLPAPRHGAGEAGVVPAHPLAAAVLGGRDEVPDERLDLLVAAVHVEAEEEDDAGGILEVRGGVALAESRSDEHLIPPAPAVQSGKWMGEKLLPTSWLELQDNLFFSDCIEHIWSQSS